MGKGIKPWELWALRVIGLGPIIFWMFPVYVWFFIRHRRNGFTVNLKKIVGCERG